MNEARCGRCGGTASDGYLLDRSKGLEARPVQWISGAPVRRWLGMLALRGRERATVAARRCRKCGAVELWAPSLES